MTPEKLRVAALRLDCTPFLLALAACHLALAACSGQQDQLVGLVINERNSLQQERSPGCYASLQLSRCSQLPRRAARPWLTSLASDYAADSRQRLPLSVLVQALQPQRLPDGNPWFSCLFVFQNLPSALPQVPGLCLRPSESVARCSQYALTVQVLPLAEQWVLRLDAAVNQFDQLAIDSLLRQFEMALENLVELAGCADS